LQKLNWLAVDKVIAKTVRLVTCRSVYACTGRDGRPASMSVYSIYLYLFIYCIILLYSKLI